MKILNKISFLALFVAILLTACQKENIDVIIPEDPGYQADTVNVNPYIPQMRTSSPDSIDIACLSIPYPVDFLQASGNTITVNSETELDSAVLLADSLVDFVYPFNAVGDSGLVLIEDVEDLVEAIIACASRPVTCSDLDAHVLLFFNGLNILTLNKYVYEINYPVTLIVEGNQIVINNDSQYLPAIGGSPFDYKETDLVYPITVTQFGRDIVLYDDEDVCEFYETLDEPCTNKPAHIQFFFNEGGGTLINCAYFINYPVDIISDNDTIQVQSRDDYLTELNSSPNAYGDIELIYPVGATRFSNGQQLSFGSDADICQYLNNCQ